MKKVAKGKAKKEAKKAQQAQNQADMKAGRDARLNPGAETADGSGAGMVSPPPTPPPVMGMGSDYQFAQDEEKRRMAMRQGIAQSIKSSPVGVGSTMGY
jgi:hypothetical protein